MIHKYLELVVQVIVIPIVVRQLLTDSKGLEKKTGGIGNLMKQNHTEHSIVKSGLNTEKSPRDMRIDITLTLVKVHQLTLL